MSLVYEEFHSDLPPSMSDEEIELLKIKYRNEKHSNQHSLKVTEGSIRRDIIQSVDEKYENEV